MHVQGTSVLDHPVSSPAAQVVLVPHWAGGHVALSTGQAAAALAWFTVKYRRQAARSATADALRAELASLLREHGVTAVMEAEHELAADEVHPGDAADTAWWHRTVTRHLAVPAAPVPLSVLVPGGVA